MVKLEGTLTTFPLRELIDMVTYSSVTGVLNIYAGESSGHLYFRDGHLYHTEFDELRGTDGLAGLLEISNGNFAFVSDLVSQEESIWGDLDFHLQTAERLAQRWRQVRSYIPSMNLIPQLQIGADAIQRRVSPLHLVMVDQIDGTRNLQQIAAELGWSAIDVAEAATQLLLDGVIDLRRNSAAARKNSGETPRNEGGLFDRMIKRLPNAQGSAKASTAQATAPANAPAAPIPQRNAAEDAILHLLRS